MSVARGNVEQGQGKRAVTVTSNPSGSGDGDTTEADSTRTTATRTTGAASTQVTGRSPARSAGIGDQAHPALAKLTRPSIAWVAARERLFERIDETRGTPLLWISASAGFGKTTLMSSYLERSGTASRWYQMDGGDSDVATFFYYMGQSSGAQSPAGQSSQGRLAEGPPVREPYLPARRPVDRPPGLRPCANRVSDASAVAGGQGAVSALPLFTSEYHADLDAFSRRYFRTLYAEMRTPFDIVLDNYHELSASSPFHEVLKCAVTEMPVDGRIVVLSRHAPPSSMARLRANRQMAMLVSEDLRLTPVEACAIGEMWDPKISSSTRDRIYQRTKGWAAGFNLMLEQVSDGVLDAAVPEAASDTVADPVIFDYLAGEVFQKFDAATRSLLLECAYLPKVSASMAAELTGETRAAEILSGLHRSLGLVSVLTGEVEPLYQHHPMLQDFLKARASSLFSPDERRRLRRRSAALLEDSGSIGEALTLLSEEEDWDELVRLTLEHAEATLRQGRAETLEQMLEALPEATASRDPWFYYWRAACRFDSAPRESRLFYEKAFAGFMAQTEPDKYALLLACSGAMDAILYELDDLSLLDEWVRVVERLVPKHVELPWPSAQARVAVSMYIALAFRQPSHPDMRYWGEQAFARLQHIEETNARVTSQLLVAMTLNYVGKFSRSREVMSSMRETCRLPQVSALAHKVLKDVEAMYYLFLADHERCVVAMEEGLEIGRATGVRLWTHHLLSSGAAGALGAADVETAGKLLERMREHQDSARRLDLVTYHHYKGWLHMLCEDPLAARQAVKTSLHLAIECGCPFYEVYCRLALAPIESALGEHAAARAQLRSAEALGAGIDNHLLHFQWYLVRAEVAFAQGQYDEGLRAVREAFAIGREHNYMHTVWWRPQIMAELCVRALEHGIETAYVQRLIRERALVPDEPPLHVADWPWPLRIHALGRFRVERDDELLGDSTKTQRKPIELLKALVGFGAFDVSEADVCGSLWPRIDTDYAQKSLSTTLHRLRKTIGHDNIILLRQGRLSINPRSCWVDLSAFEQLADEIDLTCNSDGSAAGVSALSDRLFDLYRGPFMEGENGNDRYAITRERLRGRFVRCVNALARFWEREGDTGRALDAYRRALDADTLAEGNYRQLMLCLRKLGRQAEAVEVYERCRKAVSAELGVEPSPETRAVFEKVIAEL